MNKTLISTAIATIIGTTSFSVNADLTTPGAALEATDGVYSCPIGGVYPNCTYGITTVLTGSYFAMDTNDDGITQDSEKYIIDMLNPIVLGDTTTATGSHSGSINGSETPAFDIWEFFGGIGMDYLTAPITVVNDNGTQKDLDFSGWTVAWNGISAIDMGGDAANFGTTGFAGDNNSGLALITCSTSSCSQSSTFVLDYAATIPKGSVANFGGVNYTLHLEGHVGAVPVPAAAWLFGSGLIGLIGVARRKKA